MRKTRWLAGAAAACLLVLGASPATAQEGDLERSPAPALPASLSPVVDVDLLSPRQDGPPILVLITKEQKLRPADGTYRTRDRKVLVVEDGRIVEFSDPEAKVRRFRVVNIDEVAGRIAEGPSRLFLQDARGRGIALADGQFVSESETTLVVRDGMIVGYGGGR